MKEVDTKPLDEESLIEIDATLKKEITRLKLKKMKKKNPKRIDLSKYIGFIEGKPSDSVEEHDLF